MERMVLTVREAAEALGMHQKDVYAGINAGQIPALRIGGREGPDGRPVYGRLRIPKRWIDEQLGHSGTDGQKPSEPVPDPGWPEVLHAAKTLGYGPEDVRRALVALAGIEQIAAQVLAASPPAEDQTRRRTR